MMTFSEKLYKLILERGITISELSRQSGVSRAQIYNLLKQDGTTKSLRILKSLANTLDCTVSWLLEK